MIENRSTLVLQISAMPDRMGGDSLKVLKWMNEHLEETLVAILLTGVAVLMFVQVCLRYLFSSGLSWSEVIARYMLVMMGFLSIGYSIRHRSAVRIDLLLTLVPAKLRKIFDVIVWFITLFFLGILFVTAVKVTKFYFDYGRVIAGTEIPVYIIYLIGPSLGLGLGLFRLFQNMVETISGWLHKKNDTVSVTSDEKMRGGGME